MSKHTWPLLTFLFFALTVIAPTAFSKRRLSLAFNHFARRSNLRFYPGGWQQSPRLAGYYHGRSLSVDAGRGHRLRIVLDVNAPAQIYLRLKARSPIARRLNSFRQHRINDPDFAARFAITSRPETYANTLLGRRSKLRGALRAGPPTYTLEVKAGSLIFEQVSLSPNADQLGATLQLLDDVACAIEQTV